MRVRSAGRRRRRDRHIRWDDAHVDAIRHEFDPSAPRGERHRLVVGIGEFRHLRTVIAAPGAAHQLAIREDPCLATADREVDAALGHIDATRDELDDDVGWGDLLRSRGPPGRGPENALRSRRVVTMPWRRLTPTMPAVHISRAIRFFPTAQPLARNSAWTLVRHTCRARRHGSCASA